MHPASQAAPTPVAGANSPTVADSRGAGSSAEAGVHHREESDGAYASERRIYSISRVVDRRRVAESVLIGVQALCDHIAALGPAAVEDVAGGFPHPLESETVCIPLPDGRCALVDEEDYPLVKSYLWSASEDVRVQTTVCVGGEVSTIKLHRLVLLLGENDERVGDHINHDTLDNRKTNLRACTHQQNVFNQRLSSANTSGVKGVSRLGQKWRGCVKKDGVAHVQAFNTVAEAEAWVRQKRVELHGEFACHG